MWPSRVVPSTRWTVSSAPSISVDFLNTDHFNQSFLINQRSFPSKLCTRQAKIQAKFSGNPRRNRSRYSHHLQ
jgi:hypothetical protein